MFAVLRSAKRLQLQLEETNGAPVSVLVSTGAGAGLVTHGVVRVGSLCVRLIRMIEVIL